MSQRAHRLERLGPVKEEWGPLRHVMAAADHRSYVILTEPQEGIHRLVFRDRVVAESGPHDLMPSSFSFDGSKLAVARTVIEGGRVRHRIEVNGELAYDADLSTLHHLDWLDNERLAWDGWNDGDDHRIDDGGIRRFVNGVDVTGTLDFEPVLLDRMRHAIRLKEGDMACMIYDDGSRSEPVRVAPGNEDRWHWFGWPGSSERPERPEESWDGSRRAVRVRYRGVTGPIFDGIESFGGMRSYAMNRDGRRAAYVGIRYSGAARAMSGLVGGALNRLDGEPRGLTKLWAWPLALLFNPYMGVGHAYIEGSRRYFPVDHDRPWEKGYRWAHDHFYTPCDELVVTCAEKDGHRVVIDEDEGPAFDSVIDVRHLADGDEVSYLAIENGDIIRVSVR